MKDNIRKELLKYHTEAEVSTLMSKRKLQNLRAYLIKLRTNGGKTMPRHLSPEEKKVDDFTWSKKSLNPNYDFDAEQPRNNNVRKPKKQNEEDVNFDAKLPEKGDQLSFFDGI